jgi:hypothetical protein
MRFEQTKKATSDTVVQADMAVHNAMIMSAAVKDSTRKHNKKSRLYVVRTKPGLKEVAQQKEDQQITKPLDTMRAKAQELARSRKYSTTPNIALQQKPNSLNLVPLTEPAMNKAVGQNMDKKSRSIAGNRSIKSKEMRESSKQKDLSKTITLITELLEKGADETAVNEVILDHAKQIIALHSNR